MIELRITDNREDIRRWTGLPGGNGDKALWDAGFNLDDWDIACRERYGFWKEIQEVIRNE